MTPCPWRACFPAFVSSWQLYSKLLVRFRSTFPFSLRTSAMENEAEAQQVRMYCYTRVLLSAWPHEAHLALLNRDAQCWPETRALVLGEDIRAWSSASSVRQRWHTFAGQGLHPFACKSALGAPPRPMGGLSTLDQHDTFDALRTLCTPGVRLDTRTRAPTGPSSCTLTGEGFYAFF